MKNKRLFKTNEKPFTEYQTTRPFYHRPTIKEILKILFVFLFLCMLSFPGKLLFGQQISDIQDKPIFKPNSIIELDAIEKRTLRKSYILITEVGKSPLNEYVDDNNFNKGNEYFRNAVYKLREGNAEEAKRIESDAIGQYKTAIITGLNGKLLKNISDQMTASRGMIGESLYNEGVSNLDVIRQEVLSYDPQATRFSDFSDKVGKDVDNLVKRLGLDKSGPLILKTGAYIITVNKFETKYVPDIVTGTITMTGKGYASFCCPDPCDDQLPLEIYGPIWVVPQGRERQFEFIVVENVTDRKNEILLQDAKLINPAVIVGDKVVMRLPAGKKSPEEIIQAKNNHVAQIQLISELGIPVEFSGIRVKPGSYPNIGIVEDGSFNFPFKGPPYKTDGSPYTIYFLDISPGFQLAIDHLTITPKSCVASAKLILPESLASGANSSRSQINLGSIDLSRACEFYSEYNDMSNTFGPFDVGITTIKVKGAGYIVDFRSDTSHAGLDPAWKGVILLNGETLGQDPGSVVSNTGYLQAKYILKDEAKITSDGLEGSFTCNTRFDYNTFQPSGFKISFNHAFIKIKSSEVEGGEISGGEVFMPEKAVRNNAKSRVEVNFKKLEVKPGLNLFGRVSPPANGLSWGDLLYNKTINYSMEDLEKPDSGYVFFPGQIQTFYLDTNQFSKPFEFTDYQAYVDEGLSGITYDTLKFDYYIQSPDMPDPAQPLKFEDCRGWINIASNGVNALVNGVDGFNRKLGPVSTPKYRSDSTFNTNFVGRDKNPTIKMCFIESSVYDSKLSGNIHLEGPSKIDLPFKEMLFTSTAHNAGGKVVLDNAKLDYWGVELVRRPGFSTQGLISVKTGQVILTAAGLAERQHYDSAFYLTWGEMYADGNMGRLFFDYNTTGQKLDGFNFAPSAVALSKYDYPKVDTGFLKAAGHIFFPFFGADYLNINDWKSKVIAKPFKGRSIELVTVYDPTYRDCDTSDLHIAGTWADNFGYLKYKLAYDTIEQDGFIGARRDGRAKLKYLSDDPLPSLSRLKRDTIRFYVDDVPNTKHGIDLGLTADFGFSEKTTGDGMITQDNFQLTIMGDISVNASSNVIMYYNAEGKVKLKYTLILSPGTSKLSITGDAHLQYDNYNVDITNGSIILTVERRKDVQFIEGDVKGELEFYIIKGVPNVKADGRINWHLGNDYQLMQGKLKITLLSMKSEGGLFIGNLVPKEKAFVITTEKYGIKEEILPQYLTGVYAYVNYSQSISIGIISGGYEIYTGAGVFILTEQEKDPKLKAQDTERDDMIKTPPRNGELTSFYIVGTVGGGIHGEILWGLVSASAYVNMQAMAPYPAAFVGTVGLRGCVLFICGSIDLSVGVSSENGFYFNY